MANALTSTVNMLLYTNCKMRTVGYRPTYRGRVTANDLHDTIAVCISLCNCDGLNGKVSTTPTAQQAYQQTQTLVMTDISVNIKKQFIQLLSHSTSTKEIIIQNCTSTQHLQL